MRYMVSMVTNLEEEDSAALEVKVLVMVRGNMVAMTQRCYVQKKHSS